MRGIPQKAQMILTLFYLTKNNKEKKQILKRNLKRTKAY